VRAQKLRPRIMLCWKLFTAAQRSRNRAHAHMVCTNGFSWPRRYFFRRSRLWNDFHRWKSDPHDKRETLFATQKTPPKKNLDAAVDFWSKNNHYLAFWANVNWTQTLIQITQIFRSLRNQISNPLILVCSHFLKVEKLYIIILPKSCVAPDLLGDPWKFKRF